MAQRGEAAQDRFLCPGEGELNSVCWDASSLGKARPAALRRALSQNQEHEVMEGNFRTIKGNPLPPVQPSLGKEAAASNAAAGI